MAGQDSQAHRWLPPGRLSLATFTANGSSTSGTVLITAAAGDRDRLPRDGPCGSIDMTVIAPQDDGCRPSRISPSDERAGGVCLHTPPARCREALLCRRTRL